MSDPMRIGYIDNLSHPDKLVLREGYEAPIERYMAALGGNNGNLAFVTGARKSIDAPMTRIGWGWTPDRVRNVADVIVVSCANQIGAHADLGSWADAIVAFDLPVVLLSLGAQTTNYEGEVEIPEGTRRFLTEVDARRPGEGSNIGVRGEFTRQALAQVGIDSVVLGCPSLFISGESSLGATIVRRAAENTFDAIAVAAGNPYHPENRKIEARMVRLVDAYKGAYVVQHPNGIVDLALGNEQPADKLKAIADGLGFASGRECARWFDKHAYSFHETQTWMHFLRHYDAVIGPRYHGVALGVQVGIPGVVLHIDNRTRELAETTGIPTVGIAELEDRDLAEIVLTARWTEEMGAAFDANRRRRAEDTAAFLESNKVGVSAQLRAIAGAAA